MKRLNKNVIVFICAFCFLIVGFFSRSIAANLVKDVGRLFIGISQGDENSFSSFTNSINNDSTKLLSYHNQLMDLNSIKDNLLGTKIIKKDGDTVIKTEYGSLIDNVKLVNLSDIESISERIDMLRNVAETNGANFLYCAAPKKEYYETTQENAKNYFKNNFETLLSKLAEKNIPYIDFSGSYESKLVTDNKYYYTDHHWTTLTGFNSTKKICEKLNGLYGFDYREDYVDLVNYNVTNYPDWFLGSSGKKSGTYFTWNGADDFDLITPKFDTNLTEEQPIKNEKRSGKFEDTVLFMDNMKKDYYGVNTYTTYSGGDFRLQIMKNNLNPNGKKILLIRDSFACVVAPFLALQTSELHICDMRNYEYYVGEKLNAEEYIKQIKPDYVIVLYSGVTSLEESSGRYDFF